MENKDTVINENANIENVDYKHLYLAAMNELKEISNSAIAAQRNLESMFLSQTDPA